MLTGIQSAILAVFLAAAVGELFWLALKYARKNALGIAPIGIASLADVFLLAFLAVAAMFIGLMSSRFFYDWLGADNPLSIFAPTVVLQFCIIAGVLLFRKFAGVKFAFGFGFSKKILRETLVFFAYSTFIVFLGNLLIAQSVCALTGEYPPKQEIVDIFSSMSFGLPTLLAVLSIVVFAPIAEEMFFRGVLYRLLKYLFAPTGSRLAPAFAAVLSGALFALIHADAYVFIPLMFMGICLCLAYEKTASLTAPITVHMLFNALNILIIAAVK